MALDISTTSAEILPHTKIREWNSADRSFVRATWGETLCRYWPFRAPLNKNTLNRQLDSFFARIEPRSQFRIAECNDRIIAWACVDAVEPLIQYAYTVRAFRRTGLCRTLISDHLGKPWTYTHDSALAAMVAKKLGGTFDPWTLSALKPIPEDA